MDRTFVTLLALSLVLASTAAALPAGPERPAANADGAGSPSLADDAEPPTIAGVAEPPTTAAAAESTIFAGSAGPPTPTENTTARLTLPAEGIDRAETTTVGLGLGSTLQTTNADTRARHRQLVIQERLADANDTRERLSAVDQSLIDINRWLEDLEARERDALRAHANGELSNEGLVRELARIHAEAERADVALRVLETETENDPAISFLQSTAVSLRARAERLQGPIRDRAQRAIAGEAPPTRVYVESSEEGVVLAAIQGNTYVREATLYTALDENDGTIDNPAASERARELYPWAFENAVTTGVQGFGREAYRISVVHSQGELVAYLDGDTEDVYREVQRLSIQRMPTVATTTVERDGLRIVLSRTYPGGPLDVRVVVVGTGEPVDAQVYLDGHALGESGGDRPVRTLQPRPPYTIGVDADRASFNVTVDRPADERIGG